jgi:hypothetical protein
VRQAIVAAPVVHTVESPKKLSLRRRLAYAAASLVVFVTAATVFINIFGGSLLNGYEKSKVERMFAEGHPGAVLRIGHLDYSVGANLMVAESVTLATTNTTFSTGRIAVTGVSWASLFWGRADIAEVLANATVEVTNLTAEFLGANYKIHCVRLRSSVAASELNADHLELLAVPGDKEFFATHDFRATRFQLLVPECRVSGLAFGDIFRGKAWRARAIRFSGPALDALVNFDKPVGPFVKSPLMVHEALAEIAIPLQIDCLTISHGSLRYSEQVLAGADPAVLTVQDVNVTATGIANRGGDSSAITLNADGNLMDAGKLNLLVSIPIAPTNFSLRYSGSLGSMDLTNLDRFLDVDASTRIKSGTVKDAAFEIEVVSGQARGRVRATYQNLEIAVLDKRTGAENGLNNRVASILANLLKIRSSNDSDSPGSSKEGVVNYLRKPDEEFQQFLWFALRTGVLDLISH